MLVKTEDGTRAPSERARMDRFGPLRKVPHAQTSPMHAWPGPPNRPKSVPDLSFIGPSTPKRPSAL